MKAIAIMALLVVGVFMVKNEITFRNRQKIGDAILLYHLSMINQGIYDFYPVNYYDLESYAKTLWRLWDWGYSRILPPEKFNLIKPYLNIK